MAKKSNLDLMLICTFTHLFILVIIANKPLKKVGVTEKDGLVWVCTQTLQNLFCF